MSKFKRLHSTYIGFIQATVVTGEQADRSYFTMEEVV
jgi:hypothetical protein